MASIYKKGRGFSFTITQIYLLIFFLALALRVFYLYQTAASPFFNHPIIDELEYDQWAREILSGKLLWDSIPYHGPLYPYLLAALYKIFGHNYYIGRLFGVLISSLTCVVLASLSGRAFGKSAGIIAGFLACIYWPFIYWSGELTVTTLTLFLNLIVFWFLWKTKENPCIIYFFLSGLLIGLSAATRPNILLLLPFLLIWMFKRMSHFHFMKRVSVLILGIIIIIAPITLRNYYVGREFVLVQGQSGLNLYLGLNPHLDSLFSIQPGIAWDKLWLEPIRLGLHLDSEQGRYWVDKAILLISDEPLRFFKHLLQKIFFILSRVEISSGEYIFYNKNFSPFIFNLPGFWFVSPLGICGAWLGIRKLRELDLYYIFLIGIFLSSLPFQICSRYRITMVAFLIMFSSFAIIEFKRRLNLKDKRGLAAFVIILLLGIGVVDLDIGGARSRDHSRIHLELSGTYLKMSDWPNARDHINQSLFLYPDDPDVYKTLGNIYFDMKNLLKAEKAYQKALEIEPEYFWVLNRLGTIKGMEGDIDGAERYFKKALAIYPSYNPAKQNLERCEKIKQAQ